MSKPAYKKVVRLPTENRINGKRDMERVGFFQEMSYITVDDPYVKPEKSKRRNKKPWLIHGTKTIGAEQDGYFAPNFITHNVDTPYITLDDYYREKDRDAKKKFLAGPFRNAPLKKMDCGKGSFCATIHPCPEAMSPATRPQKLAPFKFAFLTANGKKGTGYGYLDVTINKYMPTCEEGKCGTVLKRKSSAEVNMEKRLGGVFHTSFRPNEYFHPNPYILDKPMKARKQFYTSYRQYEHPAPFIYPSPTKKDGGMKAGTINPFPHYDVGEYHDPPFAVPRVKEVTNSSQKIFMPVSLQRSTTQPSVLRKNLKKLLNNDNYKCLESVLGFKDYGTMTKPTRH